MKKLKSIKKIWAEVIFVITVIGVTAKVSSYMMYVENNQSQLAVHTTDISRTNSDQVSRTITVLKNDNLIKTLGHCIEITNLAGLNAIIAPYIHRVIRNA